MKTNRIYAVGENTILELAFRRHSITPRRFGCVFAKSNTPTRKSPRFTMPRPTTFANTAVA